MSVLKLRNKIVFSWQFTFVNNFVNKIYLLFCVNYSQIYYIFAEYNIQKAEIMQFETEDLKRMTEEFREAYFELSVKNHIKVRNEICEKLYWKPSTFYSRLENQRPLKPIELQLVKDIFKNYGIEIFK